MKKETENTVTDNKEMENKETEIPGTEISETEVPETGIFETEVPETESLNTEKEESETERAESGSGNQRSHRKKSAPGSHDLIIGFLIGLAASGMIAGMIFWYFTHATKEAVIDGFIQAKALTSADSGEIENGKYMGMVAALNDPYAAYYTKEETESNDQNASGTYAGIGIGAYKDTATGYMAVSYVSAGSPAENCGLLSGDLITSIDGISTADLTLADAASQIALMDGREITLLVLRGTESLTLQVTPGKVEQTEVSYAMKEDGVGYIRILSFVKTTSDQFKAALDDLKSQGMKGLIIDLRNNRGGLVDAATGCLDSILPKGLEVYIVEKDGKRTDYNSPGDSPLDIPTILLVNGGTASASEIFTGACRDRLGSAVVGELTYGKGIVQTTFTLSDGSSVKFTTANYYTPNGDAINGKGITPDEEVSLSSGTVPDASASDAQYMKALELIRKDIGSSEKSSQ